MSHAEDLFQRMPKVELHVHLDCCLSLDALAAAFLADAERTRLARRLEDAYAELEMTESGA